MRQKFRQIQITTDETTIRLAVSRAFRDTSIDPVVASNTFQALSQLDVFDFDLFLLDLDMKDGCAFELLETMSERFPRVPTILLTTIDSHSQELINRIKEIRFDCCWDILTNLSTIRNWSASSTGSRVGNNRNRGATISTNEKPGKRKGAVNALPVLNRLR